MPSRNPALRLADIVENIDAVAIYANGMTMGTFLADRRTRDAVERCLERFSEAARVLGPAMDDRFPDVPWHEIRKIGSVLRHDYPKVDAARIWSTATQDLAALRAACATELDRLDRQRL